MFTLIPPVPVVELPGAAGMVPDPVVLEQVSVIVPVLILRLLLEAVTACPAGVTTVEAEAVPAATAIAATAAAVTEVVGRNAWDIEIGRGSWGERVWQDG